MGADQIPAVGGAGAPGVPRVVVGRYTDADGTAGLQRLRLEGASLVAEASIDLPSPSWATWVNGRIAAVSELPDSRLTLVGSGPTGLRVLSSIPTAGADACHVAASPGGEHLAVAHYTSGSVLVVVNPADGNLSDAEPHLVAFDGHGPDPERQATAHAHQITWLDRSTLLVSDLGSDLLRTLTLGPGGVPVEASPIALPPGFGPRHVVVRGDDLAVVGELSGEVIALRRRGASWATSGRVGATTTGRPVQPSGLIASGGGLVVANRLTDTLAFLRWSRDGSLSLDAEHPCGGAMPRDIAVGHGLLWVALQGSGEVVAFTIGPGGPTEVLRHRVEGAARVLP